MLRWLISLWMRRDVRRIIQNLPPDEHERLRTMPESELILLHDGFGRGLRNAFRSNRFRGLSAYCHAQVERTSCASFAPVHIISCWLCGD